MGGQVRFFWGMLSGLGVALAIWFGLCWLADESD
jgi:hypothetical protein